MVGAKFSALLGIRDAMASAVCKDGDRKLQCMTCGKELPITEAEVALSLRSGWLKCHGKTMELL
jgi:hypothetical protein